MKENEATPISMAAMPASFSLRSPNTGAGSTRGHGQFADQAHGALDEGALHDAGSAYPGQPALRHLGDAAGAARQQAVEGVDGGAHELVLAAPPAFIAPQNALGARVFARFDALGDHVGQRRFV